MTRWYVRPEDAGQTAEVAYAYGGDGTAYRRTTDRSDVPEQSYLGTHHPTDGRQPNRVWPA